jgi:hypothetical protein
MGTCHCTRKVWYAPETGSYITSTVAWDDSNKDMLIYRDGILRVNASDITGCDFSKWKISLMSRDNASMIDYFRMSKKW